MPLGEFSIICFEFLSDCFGENHKMSKEEKKTVQKSSWQSQGPKWPPHGFAAS